jgi:hypothetical protein
MVAVLRTVWLRSGHRGFAVMLAVILVIVVGSIRLIGSNANSVFSAPASSIK